MKIALIYDRVYPFHFGGGEKRAWELAKYLATQGHDVSLLTLQMWSDGATTHREGVRLVGLCLPPSGHRRSLGDLFRFSLALARHLQDNQYDLVECANFPYLSCLVARWMQMFQRYTLVVCWFEVRGWRGWWKHRGLLGLCASGVEWLVAKTIRHHSAISTLTQERMAQLVGLPAKRVKVVECGADVALLQKFQTKNKKHQLICAGRLVPHKRVATALHLLAHLQSSHPELRLKIIGEGPELNSLQTLTQSLGLKAKIDFECRLPEEDLYRAYAESLIFLFPSEMEGFGIVAIETMAAGTPLIAQRSVTSAVCSIVQHGKNGFLADSIEEWHQACLKLLNHPDDYRAICEQGLATARSFDWIELGKKTDHYFRSIASLNKAETSS